MYTCNNCIALSTLHCVRQSVINIAWDYAYMLDTMTTQIASGSSSMLGSGVQNCKSKVFGSVILHYSF